MNISIINAKKFSEGLNVYAEIVNNIYIKNSMKSSIIDVGESFKDYFQFIKNIIFNFENIKKEIPKNSEIIHIVINPIFPDILVLKICKKFRKTKIIYTMHDPMPHVTNKIKKKILNILIYRSNLKLLKMTKKFDNLYIHLHSKKLLNSNYDRYRIIFAQHPLPIVKDEYIKKNEDYVNSEHKITFSFIGNNRYNKGLDIFIEALKILNKSNYKNLKNVKFKIKGKNVSFDISELKELEIDLEDKYLPEDDFINNIVTSDVLVFPYREATQSGILAFARSLNKFCIVTDIGALAEYIKNKRNGIVIKPNDPLVLSNAIVDVLNNYIGKNYYYEEEKINDIFFKEIII